MKKQLLGKLEQKIMLVLWEAKTALKPGQVNEKLNHKYAYTTVMTVLKRLTIKKLLRRKRNGRAYLYSPLKNKELFAKNRLGGFFSEVINDFGNLAISQFVDSVKKNQENLKLLKEYLKKNV